MKTWRSVGRFLAQRLAVALSALALAGIVQLVAPAPSPHPGRTVIAIPKRAAYYAEAANAPVPVAPR